MNCLVTSVHGQCVVTASGDGTIVVWDAKRGLASQEWFAHRCGVRTLALSPDSGRLVSASGTDETLTIWDISNGVHRAAVLGGHTEAVAACAWSPDGTLIASASTDGTVCIWDAQTFEQRDLLENSWAATRLHPLQFSPDSRFLAWVNQPSRMRECTIWSPLTGERPRSLSSESIGEGVIIRALSFDPESRRIATAHGRAHHENIVRIWDVASGAQLAELVGHEMMLTDVSFSPDGRSILSASCDGSAKIWDAEDGRETASLDIRDFSIPKACFSPDGKYVATASWGATVQLWRSEDGSSVVVFTEHRAAVVLVAFSSDGEYLVSGDLDGVVCIRHLWGYTEH